MGESGCGKSTLARAIIGLAPTKSGEILWQGGNIAGVSGAQLRDIRQDIQMIFQDPLASLNPRMTVGDIIGEPLRNYRPELSKKEVTMQVRAMMARVGLLPNVINRYPHEFSGGQRQRIAIGRAIATRPELIIADEPVSALDVTIQKQILELLVELVEKHNLSMLFISHDLSVVRVLCDRVMVIQHGKLIETGITEQLWQAPQQSYTKNLLSAIPQL